MALRFSEASRELIVQASSALFLGIITRDGNVRLKICGDGGVVGHWEWTQLEPQLDAYRGFALIVRNGEVTRLIARSGLNDPGAWLEWAYIDELMQLIPRSKDFKISR